MAGLPCLASSLSIVRMPPGRVESPDLTRELVAARWHRGIAVDGGRVLRVVALMGWFPLARVDVGADDQEVIVTAFERCRRVTSPDEDEWVVPAVGVTVAFDVELPCALGDRVLIDGATRDRPDRRLSEDERAGVEAMIARMDRRPAPRLPTGREFEWAEVTGHSWLGGDERRTCEEPTAGEQTQPASIAFFTASVDFRGSSDPT
jgi:hypothetical protein